MSNINLPMIFSNFFYHNIAGFMKDNECIFTTVHAEKRVGKDNPAILPLIFSAAAVYASVYLLKYVHKLIDIVSVFAPVDELQRKYASAFYGKTRLIKTHHYLFAP